MDLNDICTNLVPYPRLHFFVSSVTPLYSLLDVDLPPRKYEAPFLQPLDDIMSHHHASRLTFKKRQIESLGIVAVSNGCPGRSFLAKVACTHKHLVGARNSLFAHETSEQSRQPFAFSCSASHLNVATMSFTRYPRRHK